MKTKKIWESKVFWMNLIAGIITLTGLITPQLLTAFGITNPTHLITIMGSVVAILNIVLRWGNPAPINNKVASGTDIKTMGEYMNEPKK